MASLFDSLGLKCDECGNDESDETQGYKVVQQRHLCPTCARKLATAILADVSHAAIKWPCPQHERKEVELFCSRCKVAVCHTCALTVHHGHQMQDIETFFADKKETLKKDVEKISAMQAGTKSFLDKITSFSKEINDHFKDIKQNILATFETKSQDQDEQKSTQNARVNSEADELIRQINEKRQLDLDEINKQYDKERSILSKNRDEVLSDLKDIETNVCQRTLDAKSATETSLTELDSAAAIADSLLVDCDGKAVHEKVTNIHQLSMDKLPRVDHDYLDKLMLVSKKIRFKRVDDKQNVGMLTGKKASFEMVKTVNIPSDIQEPFLLGSMDEQTVVFRNGNGSALYSIDTDSGSVKPLLAEEKSRGIWDLAVLPDNGVAYSDYNLGLIKIYDKEFKDGRYVGLPNDESRFAFLNLDRKGKLLAASHNSGEIHVIDPNTGTHLRTITDIECKPMMGCGTLTNGDIIVRSGNSEICKISRVTGDVKMKLSLDDWSRRINFHVGKDNIIYVTYRKGSSNNYTGVVGLLSYDGVMRKENIIEFPTSYLYRYHPRCIVPVPGTVIILNGNVLLVYKETPGFNEILN